MGTTSIRRGGRRNELAHRIIGRIVNRRPARTCMREKRGRRQSRRLHGGRHGRIDRGPHRLHPRDFGEDRDIRQQRPEDRYAPEDIKGYDALVLGEFGSLHRSVLISTIRRVGRPHQVSTSVTASVTVSVRRRPLERAGRKSRHMVESRVRPATGGIVSWDEEYQPRGRYADGAPRPSGRRMRRTQ